MIRRRRLTVLSLLGAASAALATAAVAWACSPQAFISLSPSSGKPGSAVTVTGRGFPIGGRAEIRMGSVTSVPLATASGPTFSVTVTVPQGAAGGYQIIGAIGYDASGQAQGSTAQSFRVSSDTAPPPSGQPPSPWQQRHRSPADSVHHASTAPAPKTAQRAPVSGGASPAQQAPVTRATVPAPVSQSARVRTTTGSAPAAATGPVSAPDRPLALPQAPIPVVHPASHSQAPQPQHASSAKAASHPETWPPAAASSDSSSSNGRGPELAIGIGMLGAGLVALFAGFAVAEVRRRRAPVRARR